MAGRLREVSIGKAIAFGILTFGIYTNMLIFKMSGDLGRSQGGFSSWKSFFWLAFFLPIIGGIFALVLYFKNNKQANALREQRGMKAGYLPFIFLFIPLLNIAAPFMWVSHYNQVARST